MTEEAQEFFGTMVHRVSRAVLVRTFCHVCDRVCDHDLSERVPDGVIWWCLGCGHRIEMSESWDVRLDGTAYRQESA